MANPFDQFDVATETSSANPFDQFDVPDAGGLSKTAETGGGAALGRPTRNMAQVQSEPRPLESALIGGFKGGVVDPILGTAKLLTGGNVGQEASQSMAQPMMDAKN